MPFRLLVTGSKDWTQLSLVEEILRQYLAVHGKNLILITRKEEGASKCIRNFHKKSNCQLILYPKKWSQYGVDETGNRNKSIPEVNPDAVILFHDDIIHAKGISNMIKHVMTCDNSKKPTVYCYNSRGGIAEVYCG